MFQISVIFADLDQSSALLDERIDTNRTQSKE